MRAARKEQPTGRQARATGHYIRAVLLLGGWANRVI